MRLDRNFNSVGKYAIIDMRRVRELRMAIPDEGITEALTILKSYGVLQYGEPGTEHEFFVLKLKDKYADEALEAYAAMAIEDDPEYAADVRALADRAGSNSPFCKKPD